MHEADEPSARLYALENVHRLFEKPPSAEPAEEMPYDVAARLHARIAEQTMRGSHTDDGQGTRSVCGGHPDVTERQLIENLEQLVARHLARHQLEHVDRRLLPERAWAFLHSLADMGWSVEAVAIYREELVLAHALLPETFNAYLTHIELRGVGRRSAR